MDTDLHRRAWLALIAAPRTLTDLAALLEREGAAVSRMLQTMYQRGLVRPQCVRRAVPALHKGGVERIDWWPTPLRPEQALALERDTLAALGLERNPYELELEPGRTPARENPMVARMKTSPYVESPREPMEWFARLAGRSSYTVPVEGRSTGNRVEDVDVAHALCASHDALGKALVVAVVCQRPQDWPVVHDLSYGRLWRTAAGNASTRPHLAGPHRYRLRIVMRDAFTDMLYPAKRPTLKDAAKRARIDWHAYRALHRLVLGSYEAFAGTAARDGVVYLLCRDRD